MASLGGPPKRHGVKRPRGNGMSLGISIDRLVLADKALADQVIKDYPSIFLRRAGHGVQSNLRVERRLVRVADTGEFLKLAAASLGIETLNVALLPHTQGR